jgi:hypothetical protein
VERLQHQEVRGSECHGLTEQPGSQQSAKQPSSARRCSRKTEKQWRWVLRPRRIQSHRCAVVPRLGDAVVPLLGRFLPVRAIICQASHDDRRGPPLLLSGAASQPSPADKCPTYCPQQGLFPLFSACIPQISDARLPWWSAKRAPKDSHSYSNAHKPDEPSISHQRKYGAHRRTDEARGEDGRCL